MSYNVGDVVAPIDAPDGWRVRVQWEGTVVGGRIVGPTSNMFMLREEEMAEYCQVVLLSKPDPDAKLVEALSQELVKLHGLQHLNMDATARYLIGELRRTGLIP